ncbi:cytochrome c class II [Alcanivorax xiamenensis]|uniref:Cytochrome c class II n=1 Tax=Alcanivorax xiamenensis TaxID=1177156 RepID=A0ABQ6YC70_9GAMM|nr:MULTISPECIES: cytochrome c [Alcanivorax]KAF0807723.1 cytochrome c class II [Alcanivorax xiamenensis]
MRKVSLLIPVLAAGLLSACGKGPNEAAEYRESVFKATAWHFGTLGAMAKGEQPFDQAVFEEKADIVAQLSGLPWEGFADAGSADGSHAKPAIWENRADFDGKARDFQNAAAELAEMAGSADQQALFAQVGKVGETCRACHTEYRER